MERVHAHAQMKRVLPGVLRHVLVARDTSGLQRLARYILLLPRHQVHAVREFIHSLLLHAHIVDADLGIGHTPAEARLGVRLVLDLPVASSRTCKAPNWKPLTELELNAVNKGKKPKEKYRMHNHGHTECRKRRRCNGERGLTAAHGGSKRGAGAKVEAEEEGEEE
jgi:hypothetical protein